MDFQQARFNMVEQQIRPWDVLNFDLLDALESIPREKFVQENQQGYAYADISLALPNGGRMLEPKIVARMKWALVRVMPPPFWPRWPAACARSILTAASRHAPRLLCSSWVSTISNTKPKTDWRRKANGMMPFMWAVRCAKCPKHCCNL